MAPRRNVRCSGPTTWFGTRSPFVLVYWPYDVTAEFIEGPCEVQQEEALTAGCWRGTSSSAHADASTSARASACTCAHAFADVSASACDYTHGHSFDGADSRDRASACAATRACTSACTSASARVNANVTASASSSTLTRSHDCPSTFAHIHANVPR